MASNILRSFVSDKRLPKPRRSSDSEKIKRMLVDQLKVLLDSSKFAHFLCNGSHSTSSSGN